MNLAGCKLWRLLPPQHTHLLYDRFGNELAADFDADVTRPGHFPNLAAARQHVIEITQVKFRVINTACWCKCHIQSFNHNGRDAEPLL